MEIQKGPDGGDMHAISSMYFEYVSSLSPGSSTASGLTPTEAGAAGSFVVTSIDEFLHPYPFNGFPVNVSFLGAAPEQQTFGAVSLGNGTYLVTFNCTTSAASAVAVLLNGTAIAGSPFAVQIVPGPVEPLLGQFAGANTFARAGVPAVVRLLVFDRFGNPTNATVSFAGTTLSGNAGSISLNNPVLTATGEWSFQFTASKVGGETLVFHSLFLKPSFLKKNTFGTRRQTAFRLRTSLLHCLLQQETLPRPTVLSED